MMLGVITAALVVLSLLAFLRWRKRTFAYFNDLGIPGPVPNLIWGNIWEYHAHSRFKTISKWCRKYGDVYGFYNGDVPTLVVKDLAFLHYVFVRNVQNFTDRGVTMASEQMHSYLSKSIVHAKGTHWKRIRSAVGGGFTPGKLRQMMNHVVGVADIFMDVLEQKAKLRKEVPTAETFQALMMDYIGRAAFGLDNSFQHDTRNPFFIAAQSAVPGSMTGPFHFICQCTTTLGDFMKPLHFLNHILGHPTIGIFSGQTSKIIELRRNDSQLRKPDMLQNLLDAEIEEETILNGIKSRKLTMDEVVTTTAILFLAGFETTAHALSYVTFVLAKYPDIQDKVRLEVENYLADGSSLDFEAVTMGLKYLRQVVDEALRIYPPGILFTTRQAKEDFHYNGIRYKAGTCVLAPTLDIHRDERYWANPMKFDPERFASGNVWVHKLAYQPFGMGPRNCNGARLALLEIVYTVARMVQDFKMELGDSQNGVMDIDGYGAMSTPGVGPWIKFRRLRA